MPFLAFEGLDGSGKSTLIQGLKAEFEKRHKAFVITREPGGTALGDEIRQMLLRVQGEAPVPRAEALLYQAGRAQHVDCLIRPALQAGKWVLCDRFDASSLAFQVAGRSLHRAQIDWLNDFATAGLKADLYVLLDLTVEDSLSRLQRRGQEIDRFERESQEFHERVRQAYLGLAKQDPGRWLVLAARLSPAELLQKLISELEVRKWLA
jgi:dTMP kinase